MDSEIIVVLVLIALAVGFIIWVRMHSHTHDTSRQSEQVKQESRSVKNS